MAKLEQTAAAVVPGPKVIATPRDAPLPPALRVIVLMPVLVLFSPILIAVTPVEAFWAAPILIVFVAPAAVIPLLILTICVPVDWPRVMVPVCPVPPIVIASAVPPVVRVKAVPEVVVSPPLAVMAPPVTVKPVRVPNEVIFDWAAVDRVIA